MAIEPTSDSPKRADRHGPLEDRVVVVLNAVIVAVTENVPRVLVVSRSEGGRSHDPALPFGRLDPSGDRTLELGLRGWVREQTGLELGYTEQLYTFGDRDRLVRGQPLAAEQRVLSIAYLALVREADSAVLAGAAWRDVYRFLPWEDRRAGELELVADAIQPALERWARSSEHDRLREERHERCEIAFGLGQSRWDPARALDRYELLYEAGLVVEGTRDQAVPSAVDSQPMAVDHRRILATGLSRLRGKLKYRPLVFELMPEVFTLLQLQRAVEALGGGLLHKQNFRRLVERGGLVEGTGRRSSQTGGRPAELFRFRRDAIRERPAPGVGLPSSL